MLARILSKVRNSLTGKYRKAYELNGYQIEIDSATPQEVIKSNWQVLEKCASVPFFLTWKWISTWIETYSPNLITVTASYNNRIVALGLFTESIEIRHKLIYSRQLRLHQMGDESMDQIWMEYNDFICDKDHQLEAVNACLEILQYDKFPWDEIAISMMPNSRASKIASSFPLTVCGPPVSSYITDLTEVREQKKTYLQSLAANTRQQVRRSIRGYEENFGPLEIKTARNQEEALSYFQEAGSYHIQKWHDSGFNNPKFTQFHKNLIESSFDSGSIQLCRMMAGEETIGVLYHHIVGKQVFFYLQGLNYHSDKKLKPGLVAHVFATEYYLQQEMDSYDYMGGYSQYKIQLAKRAGELTSLVIQKPRSRFRLETIARKIKRRVISSTL